MKPNLRRFEEIATKHGGNVSRIADELRVNRLTIYRWCETDQRFKDTIEEHRGRLLDRCIETASTLANGIPIRDDNGKVIGWKEKPDSWMLRYLISTIGRKEGFGDSIDVTTKGESVKTNSIIVEVIDKRELIENDQSLIINGS